MVWWLIVAGGGAGLFVYARRGQNAVWGTATVALPIGVALAIFSASFEWSDIVKFIAVGALIGLVFELLPLLQKRDSGASNSPAKIQSVRRRYPTTSHEDQNGRFNLSEGLARMPSAPDIEGSEHFSIEQISGRTVMGFRNCQQIAERRGAKATLEYPLVMALLDEAGSEVVMFVAVEKGVMFDTCMLGAFTSEGIHMNMGHWDLGDDEKAFVTRARGFFAERLSRLDT
jgi:hypothetical protein